jgi:hypothetical protein
MPVTLSPPAKLMGIMSAAVILIASLTYAVVLALGFASLASPAASIGNPYFTVLEVLILILAPAIVTLLAAVHAAAPPNCKGFSAAALSFATGLATITCSVHFLILTLSGQHGFTAPAVADAFLAFKWPSVVYALDILAWDLFFALSMLFAAPIFNGGGINRAIRTGMITSGVLALAGMVGVGLGDMTIRNIGIAGYLGVFMIVDGLLLLFFLRSATVRLTVQ